MPHTASMASTLGFRPPLPRVIGLTGHGEVTSKRADPEGDHDEWKTGSAVTFRVKRAEQDTLFVKTSMASSPRIREKQGLRVS